MSLIHFLVLAGLSILLLYNIYQNVVTNLLLPPTTFKENSSFVVFYFTQLKKLGANNIEVVIGCGVRFDHGFGVGMPYQFFATYSSFFLLMIFMLSCFSYVIDIMLHHMNSLV